MKLLWLIGIEGSGQHMIRDVLRDFLASREVIDKGDYYPLWLQRWDGEQDPLPRQDVRNVLEEILSEYQSSGCTHIYEDTSFPFGGTEKGEPSLQLAFRERKIAGLVAGRKSLI